MLLKHLTKVFKDRIIDLFEKFLDRKEINHVNMKYKWDEDLKFRHIKDFISDIYKVKKPSMKHVRCLGLILYSNIGKDIVTALDD